MNLRRGSFGLILAVAVFGIASPARAEWPASARSEVSLRRGAFCTPAGCAGATFSPTARTASFAGVSLAACLLARRRREVGDR